MGMGAIGGGINPGKISPGGPGGVFGVMPPGASPGISDMRSRTIPGLNPNDPKLFGQPGGQIKPGGPGGIPGFNPAGGGLFQPGGMGPVVPQGMRPGGGFGMPVQTMPNAVRNSQQNMNTNIRGVVRR
jgi:hypothetical protein